MTGILIEGKHSAKFRKRFGDFCFSGLKARPMSAQGNALGLLQGPWTLPMAGMGRTFSVKAFGIKLLRCHRKNDCIVWIVLSGLTCGAVFDVGF